MLFTNENSANSWQTQNRKYQIPELPIQEISLISENSPEYELTIPNLNLNQKDKGKQSQHNWGKGNLSKGG